jgi:DNA excision repair protein ERCC-3
MPITPGNPLVVQSDKTVLLEVQNDLYPDARDALARFAELEKSPEYIHTYRITPLSLWNAAAAGTDAQEVISSLERFSKYDLPVNLRVDITDIISRFGRLKLSRQDDFLLLSSTDQALIEEIVRHKTLAPLIQSRLDALTLLIDPANRGRVKQALITFGYPAEDLAGYVTGENCLFNCARYHCLVMPGRCAPTSLIRLSVFMQAVICAAEAA